MKTFAGFVAGFISALVFAASATAITFTTTAGDDTRLIPAFTALLQPGCPSACRSATAADIKTWMISQLQYVVSNYEHQQSMNAIPASAALQTN